MDQHLSHLNDDPELKRQIVNFFLVTLSEVVCLGSRNVDKMDLDDFRNGIFKSIFSGVIIYSLSTGIVFCELIYEILLDKEDSQLLKQVVTSGLSKSRSVSNIQLALNAAKISQFNAEQVHENTETRLQLLRNIYNLSLKPKQTIKRPPLPKQLKEKAIPFSPLQPQQLHFKTKNYDEEEQLDGEECLPYEIEDQTACNLTSEDRDKFLGESNEKEKKFKQDSSDQEKKEVQDKNERKIKVASFDAREERIKKVEQSLKVKREEDRIKPYTQTNTPQVPNSIKREKDTSENRNTSCSNSISKFELSSSKKQRNRVIFPERRGKRSLTNLSLREMQNLSYQLDRSQCELIEDVKNILNNSYIERNSEMNRSNKRKSKSKLNSLSKSKDKNKDNYIFMDEDEEEQEKINLKKILKKRDSTQDQMADNEGEQVEEVDQEMKTILVEWLYSLRIIKRIDRLEDRLDKICRDGVIFSDIINLLEGSRQPVIVGIERKANTKTLVISNYRKIQEYLKTKERMNMRYLNILKGYYSKNQFWGLLVDIYSFYNHKKIIKKGYSPDAQAITTEKNNKITFVTNDDYEEIYEDIRQGSKSSHRLKTDRTILINEQIHLKEQESKDKLHVQQKSKEILQIDSELQRQQKIEEEKKRLYEEKKLKDAKRKEIQNEVVQWLIQLGFRRQIMKSQMIQDNMRQAIFQANTANASTAVATAHSNKLNNNSEIAIKQLRINSILTDPIRNGTLFCSVLSRLQIAKIDSVNLNPKSLKECHNNFELAYNQIKTRAIKIPSSLLYQQHLITRNQLESFWELMKILSKIKVISNSATFKPVNYQNTEKKGYLNNYSINNYSKSPNLNDSFKENQFDNSNINKSCLNQIENVSMEEKQSKKKCNQVISENQKVVSGNYAISHKQNQFHNNNPTFQQESIQPSNSNFKILQEGSELLSMKEPFSLLNEDYKSKCDLGLLERQAKQQSELVNFVLEKNNFASVKQKSITIEPRDEEADMIHSWLSSIGFQQLSININFSQQHLEIFKDGTELCCLLQQLEGIKIQGVNWQPRTQAAIKFNFTQCIELLENKSHFQHSLLWDPQEFYDCRTTFYKKLLSSLKLSYKKPQRQKYDLFYLPDSTA